MKWFDPKFIITDLGFENFEDFATSIIGFKHNLLAPLSFISAGFISTFISNNMWQEPTEVYFLAILIGLDLLTGVWKAIKASKSTPEKKFRSRRISRTVGKIVTYSIVLFIAFNLDKNMHTAFFWMPYSCLGVFYATESWSIIENLSEIGYLDKKMIAFLKEKLNITNYLNINKEKKSDSHDQEDKGTN